MKKVIKSFFQDNVILSSKVGFFQILLLPFSLIYSFLIRLRRVLFEKGIKKINKLPVPVICVGNLTTGGTGKTPFILYLANCLKQKKVRTSVLRRDYSDDERELLRSRLPADSFVLSGAERYRIAQEALDEGEAVDCFLMDDGYQHFSLYRDLNIVLINALLPFGNGFVLPAGCLREPLDGLKRAGAIVLTNWSRMSEDEKRSLEAKISQICPEVPIFHFSFEAKELFHVKTKEVKLLQDFADKEVIGLCGIGYPEGFYKTLKEKFKNVGHFFSFLDHSEFADFELKAVGWAKQKHPDFLIVTTEKDYYRNKESLEKFDCWVLRGEFVDCDQNNFQEFINGLSIC